MSRRDSDEAVLADRLVNYADAITALAFVGVSGFGIAIADPDTRCTIVRAVDEIWIGNLGSALLFTVAILLLRRWEGLLRADAPPSARVARYARILHGIRLGVVWLSFAMLWVLTHAASDYDCTPEAAIRVGSAPPPIEANG